MERLVRGRKNLVCMDEYEVDSTIMRYVNRLSDYFFALSRRFGGDDEIKVSDIKRK